ENARLRAQLGELRSQLSVLAKENEELKAKLQQYEPKEAVAAEAAKILRVIFKAENPMMPHEVSTAMKMEKGLVIHHLRSLSKLGFINTGRDMFGFERVSVSHAGSTFIL